MTSIRDQLPRIFQANLHRLFERVIAPAMQALPVHGTLEHGEAASLDQFLDRSAAQVDNYTANEAAKSFALTIASVFERQLNVWAASIESEGMADMSKVRNYLPLLHACAPHAGITLSGKLEADLTELLGVANVVRHGEGPACEKLHASAPHLWDSTAGDYHDLLAGPRVVSEHLRVRSSDLIRYVGATTRFWGLADPQDGKVVDPPHWRDVHDA